MEIHGTAEYDGTAQYADLEVESNLTNLLQITPPFVNGVSGLYLLFILQAREDELMSECVTQWR